MGLEAVERQLAAHIRNPDAQDGPADIEPRRLKIYRELFYKNIETFISNGFPILHSLIPEPGWHAMVRDFMANHQCRTPYFLEISQEFLLYLQHTRKPQADDPAFMNELAHYEWLELALDVADENLDDITVELQGDLLAQLPVVSPLAWSMAYHYPVHKIGRDFQPDQPEPSPVYLVVYRDRKDRVGFMEANSVTARLLELLQRDDINTGQQALAIIAEELQHPDLAQVIAGGLAIMEQLRELDIILGTR